MNNVTIRGRLCADAEIRYSNGEKPLAISSANIAVNRKKKDEGADFIPVTAFGKVAELFEKYLHKGSDIIVIGHINTGNYTNKEGKKVYTWNVVADSIEFCDKKADASNSTPQEDTGFMNLPGNIDDEIPFN